MTATGAVSVTQAVCAGLAGWLACLPDPGARRVRALFADATRARQAARPAAALAGGIAFLRPRTELLCLPAGAAVAALGHSVLPLLAGIAAVPVVRRRLRARAGRKESERTADSVAALCGAVVAELRAGREPGQALLAAEEDVGALGGVGEPVLAAARFGGDVASALRTASAQRPGLVALVGVAACWRVSADSGAGLATGLDRIEQSLRAERRRREALRAQLAGAWSTVTVLALLPAAGLGLGAALGADPLHVLLHSPVGLVCLAVGALLEVTGILWAGRIVRGGESE
ncbi:type II secretion system F family protein [uncultured Streptomyces sp.]|uniref:type II secretion system F family protein n=1 Tax=uncultured Streptomyces sp. TaxID=174707 RepID=UPI002625B78A|nr:type II secretion system F family protein [uncultured Streptomyces sp.]